MTKNVHTGLAAHTCLVWLLVHSAVFVGLGSVVSSVQCFQSTVQAYKPVVVSLLKPAVVKQLYQHRHQQLGR